MSDNPFKRAISAQKGLSPQQPSNPVPPSEPSPPQSTDPDIEGEKPRKYPHRISFDMEPGQYKQLKRAAFESDRPMNEILREAVSKWLSEQVDT